jgi:hypothetical protein
LRDIPFAEGALGSATSQYGSCLRLKSSIPRLVRHRLRAGRFERPVMVLEQIGTDPARQVLTRIAGGPAGAGLREEAIQSLERLAQAPRPG